MTSDVLTWFLMSDLDETFTEASEDVPYHLTPSPGCRILFNIPTQLRKQKYAMEPAQLVLSLKLQSDQHAQMIPYNY